MGRDLMELFHPERADLLADDRDLIVPAAAESLVAEVARVDVLIANLRAMYEATVSPLHRLA
ncbi:hypothetical protein ACFYR1_08890 [Streptomyces canus]|uniref:hypothetical protein n=1 Tax=Streptomyces canus TaxID=58343 RepID=UPI0036BE937B